MLCHFSFAQRKTSGRATKTINTEAEKIFNSAERKYANGDWKNAVVEYTKAIEIDSNYINAYLRRGFCLSLTKDYEGAIKDYSKVLQLDPNHQWAYLSRGSAKNKLKDFKSALADFNKALALKPTDQEAFNNRGWAKEGLGDHKGACEDWNKSKQLGNDEAKIILENNHCK